MYNYYQYQKKEDTFYGHHFYSLISGEEADNYAIFVIYHFEHSLPDNTEDILKEKEHEMENETQRLEDLRKQFEKKGVAYLKEQELGDVKKVCESYFQFIGKKMMNIQEPTTDAEKEKVKERCIDALMKAKKDVDNEHRKWRNIEGIMESSIKLKTLSFRGMKFLDSLAFFGPV